MPSTEQSPGSVWSERGPVGPGYYQVRLELPTTKLVDDGTRYFFEIALGGLHYRIPSGRGANRLLSLKSTLTTLAFWMESGITDSWEKTLAPFLVEEEDEWWRVLRIPPDATREEIEDGYKRQAKKAHPDSGGSHEEFVRLQNAYAVAIHASKPKAP